MSDFDQDTGLALERLDRLPGHAAVAFSARCALRILPAFIPILEYANEFRAKELDAAAISGLLALHASVGAPVIDRKLALRAAKVLKREGSGPSSNARQCIASAARASAARTPASINSAVRACINAYRNVGIGLRVFDPLDASALDDVKALEAASLGPKGELGKHVPIAFFARPLFSPSGEFPADWKPVVDDWIRALEGLDLKTLHGFYTGLCTGVPIESDAVVRAINGWAGGGRIELPEPTEPVRNGRESDRGPERAALHNEERAAPPEEKTADPDPATPTMVEPDLAIRADRPLKGSSTAEFEKLDQFGFRDYSVALAALLDGGEDQTPFTMAINAPWGAGKTSLANMIEAELIERRRDAGLEPPIFCRFNAWMHDDARNVATAFISEVTRTANRYRAWPRRILEPVPAAVLTPATRKVRQFTLGTLVVLLTVGGAAWIAWHLTHVDAKAKHEAASRTTVQSAVTTQPGPSGKAIELQTTRTIARTEPLENAPKPEHDPDGADPVFEKLQSSMIRFGTFATALGGFLGVLLKVMATTSLSGFVQSPQKTAEAGAIPLAGEQLKRLIEQATRGARRFVIFIDDIERCKPPGAIDVLDAVSQMMDHKHVQVILLGDMPAVAAAAQLKYKELAAIHVPSGGIPLAERDRTTEAFGRLYVQKIVQFQFDLPVLSHEQIRKYLLNLA